MLKKSLCFFILIIILVGCKKKDVIAPPTNTYISKQTFYGTGIRTFNYTAQNQLQSVVFASENEAYNKSNSYTVVKIDATGKITEAVVDYIDAATQDINILTTYDANNRIILEKYTNTTTNATTNSVEYMYSGNQITTTSKNSSGNIQSISITSLTTDGKNIDKIEYKNAAGVLQSTTTYTGYTTSKSYEPLYPVGYGNPSYSTNTYSKATIVNASTGASNTSDYTYEYNVDGYATKRTNTTTGNANTYEYVKK